MAPTNDREAVVLFAEHGKLSRAASRRVNPLGSVRKNDAKRVLQKLNFTWN
jgi:hypothetical protein